MIGSVTSESTLFTAVSVMLRATSPRARWLNRFAVAPPGEAASSMSPTASSGGSENPSAMNRHTNGRISIWQPSPSRTGRGTCTTRLKSATVRLSPSPSMMTPSATGRSTTVRRLVCTGAQHTREAPPATRDPVLTLGSGLIRKRCALARAVRWIGDPSMRPPRRPGLTRAPRRRPPPRPRNDRPWS